ncbi:MAG: Bax inhibitor-1/YccA family protein [Planctomycetota bacterium]
MRTANPALNDRAFANLEAAPAGQVMTIAGTVNKTAILLGLLVVAASFTWRAVSGQGAGALGPWLIGGMLGALVISMVTIWKREWAPVTAPIYALCEGLLLGAISAVFESRYPGIAIQAVTATFGTLACLLIAYRSGLIKPTENFKLGVIAATGAICLVYLLSFVLRLFGVSMGFIHDAGPIGILVSVAITVVAALNLVLDFDYIEAGAARGAPRYMEWYAAFGLLVTLVWLYLEILRLLSKLRRK